ncbi:MAG: hypothetical protein ACJAZM_002319 [Cyclobacteriaceae bacterium]|jgi:hypothetical protein
MNSIIQPEVIKLEAHNIAVRYLEEDLKELNQLITEKRDDEDGIPQGQIDSDSLAHNMEDQNNILAMKQRVIFLKAQLALINKYKDAKPTTIVDPGSLVFVQDQAFYISTSVESFNYNDHKVTCLSTEAPIYKAMKGMKAGDNFECNKKSYTIKKIA